MSESSMWKALRPLLKDVHAVRIETKTMPGIPDVNFSHGWIELKYVEKWPSRGGVLRIPHFTAAQKNFLLQRQLAGGEAFLLLKVGKNEWLLFRGSTAARCVGKVCQKELYQNCLARWARKPKKQELLQCLKN